MSTHGVPPAAAAWDVGARVAIFGAVDSGRWATLGLLVRRALESGRAVVVADQGLDPLADQLDALAGTLGAPFRRWPASQARTANRGHSWERWRPGRAPVEALPAFGGALWVDLPASGLDVAGFVHAVHAWRTARAAAPVVVVAHDLAWRDDAGALLSLWDAAAASEGRLCAILTTPGLPSEPGLRSALLGASAVYVHRLDSHADAVILADYLNQPLEEAVEEHGITVHDRTNILPIAAFWLTLPDHDLPLVLVDGTGRPDFVDLFRVTRLEGEGPEVRVGWLVSPLVSPRAPSIQMTCQVVQPVRAAYTLWFRAPEHTQLLRRIAAAGRFLRGVKSTEERAALDAWVMDGRLPSTVQAALDRW
jgi:hypothetical protein